jgi:hypothetical protein
MNALSLNPVITKKLPVLRSLCSAGLALPSELVVGYEMVYVSMLRVHVFLRQGNQKKDFRILDNESGVPNGLTESEAEGRCDGFTQIASPDL